MKSNSKIPHPLSVMGTNVTPFESFEDTVRCISARIANKQKTFCVAINPEKVYHAMHDPSLASALAKCNIGLCDGVGVVLAAKILHGRILRRCTDGLLEILISLAAMNSWRVFFLGASEESNKRACANFLRIYPELQIVGRKDGYFRDSQKVVHQINESQADLLFVAMGSPEQELWIAQHIQEITAFFCMGIGGALDVVSGKVKRAPKVFRKIGTEFLYRLIMQPKRFRRQLVLSVFAVMILKEKLASSTR
ncbi:MAG: WecB/TagA/CpsF family glycosyltransferase [Desulfobacterales bacterium]|nr:WecB/TagA/CpsF family glycosyltransferase [Desulfobacterales bacterium]